jgi:hypothetical protein
LTLVELPDTPSCIAASGSWLLVMFSLKAARKMGTVINFTICTIRILKEPVSLLFANIYREN